MIVTKDSQTYSYTNADEFKIEFQKRQNALNAQLKQLKDEALTTNADYLANSLHTRLERENFNHKAFGPTRHMYDDYGTQRFQSQLSKYSNSVIAGNGHN